MFMFGSTATRPVEGGLVEPSALVRPSDHDVLLAVMMVEPELLQ